MFVCAAAPPATSVMKLIVNANFLAAARESAAGSKIGFHVISLSLRAECLKQYCALIVLSSSVNSGKQCVRYGLTCSTSGIGLSGAAVAISRLNRSVIPSNIHPPSLQREPVSIDSPTRTRNAFAVASRSAR